MATKERLLRLEIIDCRGLRDRHFLGKQDSYVVAEYAGSTYRTKTCKNGGENPRFNEEFQILIRPRAHSIKIDVFSKNNLTADDHIASGTRILLHQVLQDQFHDWKWPLTTNSGRRSGEIRVIMELISSASHDNIDERHPQNRQVAFPFVQPHFPHFNPQLQFNYNPAFPYTAQPQPAYLYAQPQPAYLYAQPQSGGFWNPQNNENFAPPPNVNIHPPPSAPPPPAGATYYNPQQQSPFPSP
ncbi:hypothetical protein KP509_24G074600 [Ceratopteris richardii]|uniref:C2 domain-containing protein n=1 Tax=Ceratopteris richardii TaxID=49495 RepID=A0A8T2RWG2_CERRI|nr:hypothetical protein KP509_24G074600 [Ceratopteris richardii]